MDETPEPHTPHGRFAEWLRTLPESQTATAFRLGCSTSYVSRIAHGKATPGRSIANAIEKASSTWKEGPILASEWDSEASKGEESAA